MICECPDHLPANATGGKEIEVMQVIGQAKASRGGTLRIVQCSREGIQNPRARSYDRPPGRKSGVQR